MSTANRNHHAPPTPQHDDKIYSHELQSRKKHERVSPQHLIAAIATDPDNVHPSWWRALKDKPDLHHHRAQAIAHIDPDIAEKKIARWCAKKIKERVAQIKISPAVVDNSPFDLLPSPTNSHIDQETLRTVADSIAYQYIKEIHPPVVDHRAYQWLHAALQRNATTPKVEKACQGIFQELYQKGASIGNPHSWNGYQERDLLCFFFGSTQAAIDFLQRVRLKNQTERDARDRLCHILAEEHHDPAPYHAPPMPHYTPPIPYVDDLEKEQAERYWEKIWTSLHCAHHMQVNLGRVNLGMELKLNSHSLYINRLRILAKHASPHAQRTLAECVLSSLNLSFPKKEKSELEQQKNLLDAVLEPLESHDPRSVPENCYAALVCHSLEHGRTPHPMFGKMLQEILASGWFVPSPSQRALAYAWALAQAQNRTESEKRDIAEQFLGNFMRCNRNDLPAFSQAWKKICPLQEQQQHLLQHPAALLMPTPGMGGYLSCTRGYTMYRQAKDIFDQYIIAAASVLAALPADDLPLHHTPVLELLARNDRARKALTEHFGNETICGALTSLLLTTEDDHLRQTSAQALAYLSQENRP